MKKLVRGIIDFRKRALPNRREIFAKLSLGQSPDVLFITCSDSRIAPNWFASMDPGDLFVVRNIGNLVPPCDHVHHIQHETSVAAAMEFSLLNLKVSDIIICGHSECGAMRALEADANKLTPIAPNLRQWLAWGEPSLGYNASHLNLDPELAPHNRLSQINVLQQLDHLRSHPIIHERIQKGQLRVHGWWFDIAQGSIYNYEEDRGNFVLIDEEMGEELIKRL